MNGCYKQAQQGEIMFEGEFVSVALQDFIKTSAIYSPGDFKSRQITIIHEEENPSWFNVD